MRILDDNAKMDVKETTFLYFILHYRRGEAGIFENVMFLF
jgi:hypothetical protein